MRWFHLHGCGCIFFEAALPAALPMGGLSVRIEKVTDSWFDPSCPFCLVDVIEVWDEGEVGKKVIEELDHVV